MCTTTAAYESAPKGQALVVNRVITYPLHGEQLFSTNAQKLAKRCERTAAAAGDRPRSEGCLQSEMRPQSLWRNSKIYKKRTEITVARADFIESHLVDDLFECIHLVSHQRDAPFPIVESG